MKAPHYEIFFVVILYPFRPWYLPQHPVLKYPQSVSFSFGRVQYNAKRKLFTFNVLSCLDF
jgi:hypothetical protein